MSINKRLMVEEGQLLAVFNSGHRVMQAEDLLKQGGFQILLIPAPRRLQTDCGLAIRFDPEERERIMQTLAEAELLPAFIAQSRSGEFTTIWGQNARQ